MDLGKYSIFFLLSMVKFLFAPFGGPASGLTFFETYISCIAGAIISASIFYFMSEYFLKKAHEKRHQKIHEAIQNGIELPHKNKFTKTNKFVVKMKLKLGIYGVAIFAPLFLSIPLGTIITAKFYGKEKSTYPIILMGIVMNGLILCGIAYFAGSLF
ncbi:MAG: hypothetical protein HYR91_10640 [Flavobacteriia bacterium]|nr:hypothetical protein [Flavobacteriia bacterium]